MSIHKLIVILVVVLCTTAKALHESANPKTRIVLEITTQGLQIGQRVVLFAPKQLGLRDIYDAEGNVIQQDPNPAGVVQRFVFQRDNFDQFWPQGARDEVFDTYCEKPRTHVNDKDKLTYTLYKCEITRYLPDH